MGFDNVFNPHYWAVVPFHFWSAVFFAFGCVVGSFLNVCIYRMPLDLSVVSPPSHCPHCKYAIPFYLNVPLLTWLTLRGRCKNCGAPISPRYFIVELLTGLAFLACWLAFGHASPWIAVVYCLFLAGLMVATFIDFEHFIIPDEITYGGAVVGFVISIFLPQLHGRTLRSGGAVLSLLGIVVGAGIVYAVLRLGKLLFGKYLLDLDAESRVIFTESGILLPPKRLAFEQLYHRSTGWFGFRAARVELVDRCYMEILVAISATRIIIKTASAERSLDRDEVPHIEAIFERQLSAREVGRLVGVQPNLFQRLSDGLYSLFESLIRKAKTKILPGAHLVFTPAEAWLSPDARMYEYGEIFYRDADAVSFHAREVEMQFRSWRDVPVRLQLKQRKLNIGDAEFDPDGVSEMKVVTDRMIMPREAMGLGDVKFMAAIGAFIGWQGAFFSLLASSLIGSVVGVTLIVMRRSEWSSRIPYGPYIALAAALWIFSGKKLFDALFQ
jgi:leader peptidase (prepilin peptidase)/N-methyltransferase